MVKKFYLGDAIYGANDGIITTFAVAAGVIGADLSLGIVLIIGFASLVADGFSMATSNYLAQKSERAVIEKIEGIRQARREIHTNPYTSALVTFVAFIFAGLIPLAPFLFTADIGAVLPYAIFTTGFALFSIGAARTLVTGRHWFMSGLEMALIGGAAASLAYFIGEFISGIVS